MHVKKIIDKDEIRIIYLKRGNNETSTRGIRYEIYDEQSDNKLKGFELTLSNDFSFYAWTNEGLTDKIDFTIEKDNPIYSSIFEILHEKNQIVKRTGDVKEGIINYLKIEEGEQENIKIELEGKSLNKKREYKFDEATVISYNVKNDKTMKELFDKLDISLAPKETLEEILMPENIMRKITIR